MDRTSFMAANGYVVLPSRLQQYGFTREYGMTSQTFVMATPSLAPRWDNLLFPLSWELGHIGRATYPDLSQSVLEVYKILLGQDFSQWRARTTASRLVVATWLVVALVVGVAYRGNLTASLTSPMYPPRPETAAEMVRVVERINIPPYGADWKKFYEASNSEVFQAIAKLLYIGPSMEEGLRLTTEKNHAVISSRSFLDYIINQNFTDATGKAKLYMAKTNLDTVFISYPIPHGAPYKPQLDRLLLAFVELLLTSSSVYLFSLSRPFISVLGCPFATVYQGLNKYLDAFYYVWLPPPQHILIYDFPAASHKKCSSVLPRSGMFLKWHKDLMEEVRAAMFNKQRRQEGRGDEATSDSQAKALTTAHMQGPFLFLVFGLVAAFFIFLVELVSRFLSCANR
ncbi:Variant Ionotropic Glutamate Receptor [Penaeus vannamei]|uniref:Variant Ionotropic Glutamate Receptor n=1 Tax=Penaeus vannamei TaxID=6689 RepID=A0A3R7P5L3_PENVA|nr:Variant Ionotropic Glutamate Receptor [Penaeus vannamei]